MASDTTSTTPLTLGTPIRPTFKILRSDRSIMEGAEFAPSDVLDYPMVKVQWAEGGVLRAKSINFALLSFLNQDKKIGTFVEILSSPPSSPCGSSEGDSKEFLFSQLFLVHSCSTRINGIGSHWFAINSKTYKLRMVYVPEICKLVHTGKIDHSVITPYLKTRVRLQEVYDHEEIERSKTMEEHLEETILF